MKKISETNATKGFKTQLLPRDQLSRAPHSTTRQANLMLSGGKGRTPDPARSSAFERILAEFEHIWRNAGIHTRDHSQLDYSKIFFRGLLDV